jgi:hypothetical protein
MILDDADGISPDRWTRAIFVPFNRRIRGLFQWTYRFSVLFLFGTAIAGTP